jgi:hypothetical protein
MPTIGLIVTTSHFSNLVLLVIADLEGQFLLKEQFALLSEYWVSLLDKIVHLPDTVELKGLFT